jgi:hypothetical protein
MLFFMDMQDVLLWIWSKGIIKKTSTTSVRTQIECVLLCTIISCRTPVFFSSWERIILFFLQAGFCCSIASMVC